MKRCYRCKQEKPNNEFHKRKASKDGLQEVCISCQKRVRKQHINSDPEAHRNRSRRHMFKALCKKIGVTPEFIEDYGDAIEWYCEICGADIMENNMHMDHNHSTGNFRGLLCNFCNPGLGYFRDSPELLAKAIKYLENRDA